MLYRPLRSPMQGDGGNSPASSTDDPDPISAQRSASPESQPVVDMKKAAMRVPKGGSMCANCKYLAKDGQNCQSSNFIKWEGPNKPAGSSLIPAPVDEYCSNWYEPKINLVQPRDIARPGTTGGTNPGSQPAGANSNGPLQPGRLPLSSPGSVRY